MTKRTARVQIPLRNGHVLVGSDAHFWPGKPTTAWTAFLQFAEKYEPKVIVMNGDVIDASTISRHPPIGWEKHPTIAQEIEVAQSRLGEIERLGGKDTRYVWTLGNHDARFETKIASLIPEVRGVSGVHLRDHFPAWTPAWSVEIGGPKGIFIKHRFKGGSHAAYNNAVASGRSILTGHLHSLKVTPYTDYDGTRWGVEGGMLANPNGDQFLGYTEDNPVSWQSGFVLLTFKDGRMLWPETVWESRPGYVQFRGEERKV